MSWNCVVNLYFAPEQLGAALQAAARVVVPPSGPPCAVALPGGEVLHLPFTPIRGQAGVPARLGRPPAWFGVALKVPADEVTDAEWDEEPYTEGSRRYINLDSVALIVSAGERYAVLSFHATIQAASSVLYESPSAHDTLLGLLRQAGGRAGAILTDTVVEVRDLADPKRQLAVDWDWVRAEDEAHFDDRLAEAVVSLTRGEL